MIMKKNLLFILVLASIQVLATSCASTGQLAALEKKTNDLSLKVDAFDKKYNDVLNENKMLKDRLQDKIPIASSQVNGILFEAMKVEKDGTGLNIEILITNKNDYDINLGRPDNTTIVDDLGNQYKVDQLTIGKGDPYTVIYSNTSVKMIIKINNIKSSAKSLTVIGFDDIFEGAKSQHFRVSLKNLPIK